MNIPYLTLFFALFLLTTPMLLADAGIPTLTEAEEKELLTPAINTAIKDLRKWPKNARAAFLMWVMPERKEFLHINKNNIADKAATFMSLDRNLYNWWDAKHMVPNKRWNAVDGTIKPEHRPLILKAFSSEVARLRQYNGLNKGESK